MDSTEKRFSLDDLRAAFVAGEDFQDNYTDFNIGEVDEITKPDFGEWVFESFNIEL